MVAGSFIIHLYVVVLGCLTGVSDSQKLNFIKLNAEPGCTASIETDQGLKWIYLRDDLKLIGEKQYKTTPGEGENSFFMWRPCQRFDISLPDVPSIDNNCDNSYLVKNKNNRECYCLGHDGYFEIENSTILSIHYTIDEIQKFQSKVRLICNSSLEAKDSYLTCDSDCLGHSPILSYHSKYVCLRDDPVSRLPLILKTKRFSPGSLILIIGAFVFVVYLITGFIRGSIKGRSGLDRLPNSDFWFELPILVKDGCLLLCCCSLPYRYRKRREKDEIYQPIVYGEENAPVADV